MTSSKLSSRRQTARKPPVCHSGPPVGSPLLPSAETIAAESRVLETKKAGIAPPITPRSGRCPPPPPPPQACDCWLDPAEQTIREDQMGGAMLHYCRDLGGGQIDVDIEYGEDGGSFAGPLQGLNCVDSMSTYAPTSGPGDYNIWAKFTWPDAFQCTVYGTVHVTPRGG